MTTGVDWLHCLLFGLLFVQGIGLLLTSNCLFCLLEDLSSTEMRIATLVEEVRRHHGLVGTDM
jgi:hypothetical protein